MNISDFEFFKKMGDFVTAWLCLDEDFNICASNESVHELFGSNINLPFSELGYDDMARKELTDALSSLKHEKRERIVTVIRDRNDRARLMDIQFEYDPSEAYAYRVTIWDVSNLEADIVYNRDNMWKYRAMLGMTSQIFFDYDMEKDVITFFRYVSKKSIRIFHGTFEEFKTRISDTADKTDKNIAAVKMLCENLKEGKNSINTIVSSGVFHADDKAEKLRFIARFDDMFGHRFMYGVVNNMSETDSDLPYYMTSAGLDSATGLLSKRSLVEFTEDIFTNPATASRKHYMVLLDIDDFKNVNDNFGHQAGDKAIQLLSTVLSDCVAENGIVGRFGGDEFYILTENIDDEEDLRSLLRRIRYAMEARSEEELNIKKLTLSMGVSLFPDNGDNYNDLMQLTDKALYIAKEKGKNRYIIYRPQMHENIVTGVNRKGLSSYDEQSKAINQVVRSLFIDGVDAIEKSLPVMVKGFDLDSIDIFVGSNMEKRYTYGKYPSNFEAQSFLSCQKYMDRFDRTGFYAVNSHVDLKNLIPEVYETLHKHNCMSIIQLALPNADDPKYFISFNMLNRQHKWSDAEKSNLGLFGTLVYECINKKYMEVVF